MPTSLGGHRIGTYKSHLKCLRADCIYCNPRPIKWKIPIIDNTWLTSSTTTTGFQTSFDITMPFSTNGNDWFYKNNTYNPVQPLTPAQIQAQIDKIAKETLEKERAKVRARKLLRQSLNRLQKKQLEMFQYFDVISQTGKTYRIHFGRSRNVKEMVGDKVVATLCAHPTLDCPNEDTMLAQKLMLETDEMAFLYIANIERLTTDHIERRDHLVAQFTGVGLAA